jgi:hypothetical protein
MKTISILSRVFVNLTVGLALQQIAYGLSHNAWIDFSTWSATTLGFELVFLLSIVFSSIRSATRVAVRPMNSSNRRATEDVPENIYTPKDK